MSLEQVMPALEISGGLTPGDSAWAEQIIAEFERQPATCHNCGDLTFRGGLEEMEDLP